MICQEQQNKKQLLLLETPINKTNPEEQVAKETCKRETTKMNPTNNDHREPEQIVNNECHSNAPALAPTETLCKTKTNASTLTDLTASLFYDSSSAISLTRSFEANTSYTVGLAYARGSFKTGLQDVRRQQEQQQQQNTYHLTPNKCLAELERLYAEFRASENLREQKLREAQNNRKTTTTEAENMRLNVPANTNTNTSQTEGLKTPEVGGKIISENVTTTSRINPSTSSVFLTKTNSVTTITNPCQRTPSLTIQVNQNNNDTTTNNSNNLNNSSNNNNNTTNNNINVNNIGSSSQHITNESQQIVLNQAIVNTTTNGVSVINCNYVNNNLNNNNNNNKSITNLCDNATNTTHNLNNNDHYKNFQNISKNHNDINSVTNANSDYSNRNNSDNIQNSPTSHSSVPQVLNVNNMKNDQNNDHKDQIMPENNDKHLKNSSSTQVKVIQINEVATKAQNNSLNSSSTTPSSSPRRTFTSTECQTDDISSVQLRSPSATRPPLTSISSANSSSHTNNRDQRRRERRERRHLQHTASLLVAPTHSHPHPNHPLRHGHLDRHSMPAPPLPPILHPPHLHPGHLSQTGHNVAMLRPMLPDILHNHYPPPYSALPGQSLATAASGSMPHHNGSPIPFSHPHAHPLHPPPQTPTATILGPPPPPPPAGTTLLTSVISTVPIPGATPMVSDGRFTLPLPIMRR